MFHKNTTSYRCSSVNGDNVYGTDNSALLLQNTVAKQQFFISSPYLVCIKKIVTKNRHTTGMAAD